MSRSFHLIYTKLLNHYGPQNWWPAETPFEMMIGSILVQNTNWRNVEKALKQLQPYLEPVMLSTLPIDDLAQLIRSSGFYTVKAKRIKAFLAWFKQYDFDIPRIRALEKEKLREQLLNIHGIGRETADVMLVYAFDKPVFVVDAYARRVFYRLGYDMPTGYDAFRQVVEKELPNELQLYNEYHALIVKHAKEICRKKPRCQECPLLGICEQRIG